MYIGVKKMLFFIINGEWKQTILYSPVYSIISLILIINAIISLVFLIKNYKKKKFKKMFGWTVPFIICILLFPVMWIQFEYYNYHDECGCCVIIDYDEKEFAPIGGKCLEFDYERNIVLIGTNDGLGLYYLENNTHYMIGNHSISTLTIDYNHDIYYIGTYDNGINKFFINNGTYMSDLPEFQDYKNIREITYNHFNDSLLIGYESEVNNEMNSVYYDKKNDLSLTYSFHQYKLSINNHNNNSQLTIDMPNNNIFYEWGIKDLKIEYDYKFKLVVFGLSYQTFNHRNPNSSLVIYDIENGSFSYVSIPYTEYYIFNEINDISLDPDYHILFIASKHGLYFYSMITGEIWLYNTFSKNNFISLTFDYNNKIIYMSEEEQLDNINYYYLYEYDLANATKYHLVNEEKIEIFP